MAVRQITSDPKPSTRLQGYWYAYYNKATPEGGECVAVFSPALRDLIRKGFAFDDSVVEYSEDLRASVLNLDFTEPANPDGPSLPPDPEAGWGDPDCLPSTNGGCVNPPRAGHRPSTLRKQLAQTIADSGSQLPADFLKINLEVSRAFLLQLKMLGSTVNEGRRADVAQKLTAIASIPYYRAKGVELTDDDVKGMTF